VPVAHAREKLGIDGMRAEVARAIRDASHMRDKLAAAGLPVARYSRIESVEDGLAFASDIGYFPLVVKPNAGAGRESTYRVNTEDELRALLERLQPNEDLPLICEEFISGQECTLEVVSIGGVPAWFSATRFGPAPPDGVQDPGTLLTITLPREKDDPADPRVRRMGFAALKALEIETGMASISWFRRLDGTPVIGHVTPNPTAGHVVSLMGLAHGADMYRAWGNAIVNGLFAPIPRLYAAGAAYFRAEGAGSTISAMPGLDGIVAELGNGFVLVRHAETAVVDDVLTRIVEAVRVSL
jgi:hypothetical protein